MTDAVIINLPDLPIQLLPTVSQFDALRALPSITLATGDDYLVNGNAAIGDAGGGLFVWSGPSLLADNDRSVIKPDDLTNLQAGRWILLADPSAQIATSISAAIAAEAAALAASAGAGLIGFSQSATYAAGSVGDHLKRFICVTDAPFLAKGDGATDDTAAINAAILAAAEGTLWFPHGTYKVTAPIVIGNPVASIKIVGDTMRYTGFLYTGSGKCLTASDYLDNFEIHDMNFDNRGTGAVGLQVNCTKALVNRCGSVSLVSWSRAWASNYSSTGYTYYTRFVGCYGDNSFANAPLTNTTFIEVSGGHTAIVDGCMSNGYNRGVKVTPNGINSLLGLSVVNSRIEAGATDGGADAVGIYVDGVVGLNVAGGSIEMGRDENVASAAHRAIKLVDCSGGKVTGIAFQGGGVITAAIDIADAKAKDVVIEGNGFQRINGYCVVASGTGTLVSCDIGVNSVDVADGLYLDTFTPVLTFGGGSTGLTYFGRSGFWQRSGNYLEFSMRVQLTAKGSSTGAASIAGLPVASVSSGIYSGNAAFSLRAISMNVGGAAVYGEILAGQQVITLRRADTGAILLDSDFTNGTDIIISGQYLVMAG